MFETQGQTKVLLIQLRRKPALKRGCSNLPLSIARSHGGALFAKGAARLLNGKMRKSAIHAYI
jgi:hypothetical protein